MIQYPTNVSPENVAIVSSRRDIDFTFNGDILSTVTYRIRNYDTGDIVYSGVAAHSDLEPLGYNGSYIPRSVMSSSFLTSGQNYTLQMMLTQHTADSTTPIYDMPVLSGTILPRQSAVGGSATQICAEKNISAIYPWGGDSTRQPTYHQQTMIAGMVMRLGEEERFITSYTPDYDSECGIIEIETPFTEPLTAGKPYKIYSNFLITPQYYFSCRDNPTVSFTHICYDNRIYCKGTYSQADNSMIKYYQLELQWSNNSLFINSDTSNDRMESVIITDKIYSQNISYNFANPYRHDDTASLERPDYYRILCTIVTQDNAVYTADPYVISILPTDYSEDVGNILYAYTLSWDKDMGRVLHTLRGYGSSGVGVSGEYELFREDLDSGEVIRLHPHFYTYLSPSELQGYDITASTHGHYKYTLKKFDSNGGIVIPVISSSYTGEDLYPSAEIQIDECAYYISELKVMEGATYYHSGSTSTERLRCYIGDTWKFVGEISDTTVVNNLDRVVHVGYNQYINTTSTDVNYMSGTLSAMLGYVNCTTHKYIDDIALVRAWRKFITQKKMFLLRSQKGDVWVVKIVENPSTQYQENYSKIPTTFTFSWAECCNINDIDIYVPPVN